MEKARPRKNPDTKQKITEENVFLLDKLANIFHGQPLHGPFPN